MRSATDEFLAMFGLNRPLWMDDAACIERPDLDWFPGVGVDTTAQRAICAGCLVAAECRAAGIEGDEHGIWGGTSARQRDRIRRGLPANITSGRPAAAAAPTPPPAEPTACASCHGSLPPDSRRHAVFCSTRCRMAAHRARKRDDAPPVDDERGAAHTAA